MDQYAHKAIEELMTLEENQKCFDCGNSNPKWASLSNGVFVCLKCAGLHRSFGVTVSFIRSLTIDSWDERQIEFLTKGGNRRFKMHLEEFKVPENATLDFKYMIRASDFYRKLLKSEVAKTEPPFKPDIISGLEMLEYGVNPSPSFDNSTPITSNINTKQEKKGFFQSVSTFLAKAGEEVKLTANKVGSKIKEMDIPDKLKQTGQQTIVIAKATGNFVVEKGKEVYHSEFVQNIAHKTEDGINIIVDKTKKLLTKDKRDLPLYEGNESFIQYNSQLNHNTEKISKISEEAKTSSFSESENNKNNISNDINDTSQINESNPQIVQEK